MGRLPLSARPAPSSAMLPRPGVGAPMTGVGRPAAVVAEPAVVGSRPQAAFRQRRPSGATLPSNA
jgi:hypothetical protein